MSKAPTDYDELVADNKRLRLDKRDLIASRERCRKALTQIMSGDGDPVIIAQDALARIDEKQERS